MRHLMLVTMLTFAAAAAVGADETVIEIDIDGMTCPFCVYSLEKELGKLSAVKHAMVSLKSSKARLVLKEGAHLDTETLQDLVLAAGFTPREVRDISDEI